MKNSKMSLDAFKANAELGNEMIALDTIQGGTLSDCHGFSGKLGKVLSHIDIDITKDGVHVGWH